MVINSNKVLYMIGGKDMPELLIDKDTCKDMFEMVEQRVYLETLVTRHNNVFCEMKPRIATAYRTFFRNV